VIDAVAEEAGFGFLAASAGQVIWEGIWGSYYAILAIATYHELRAIKEGVDIDQVAAVFE